MVVRMRQNRSQTRKRRSHHSIKGGSASRCPSCGALKQQHRACPSCGLYRGRVIVDTVAAAKRTARRQKRHEKELQESGQSTGQEKETAKS